MLKPLELNAYPKHIWRAGLASMPVYEWNGIRLSERNANLASQNKRLTNAELSAEYWQERAFAEMKSADLESCQHGEGKVADRIFTSMQRNRQRAAIIHRFATLPHYDEKETP